MPRIAPRPGIKMVALFRHLPQVASPDPNDFSWHPDAPLDLSVAGPLAERIHREYLDGVPLAYGGASRLLRAQRTLGLIVPQGARNFVSVVGLGPIEVRDWGFLGDVLPKATKGETAKACYAANLNVVGRGGAIVWDIVSDTAKTRIRDGELAVLVSHGPLCEVATMYANGMREPPDDWAKGAGRLFHFDPVSGEHERQLDMALPIPPAT